MADAPVLLLACLQPAQVGAQPAQLPPEVQAAMRNLARMGGSSIYPAVQNIILACRAFGLGTVLTTIHMFYEDEVKAILGLPAEVQTYALLPIGYPSDKFGPIKRRPVSEVVCLDRYGNPWKGLTFRANRTRRREVAPAFSRRLFFSSSRSTIPNVDQPAPATQPDRPHHARSSARPASLNQPGR
jgi:hypothetical protein